MKWPINVQLNLWLCLVVATLIINSRINKTNRKIQSNNNIQEFYDSHLHVYCRVCGSLPHKSLSIGADVRWMQNVLRDWWNVFIRGWCLFRNIACTTAPGHLMMSCLARKRRNINKCQMCARINTTVEVLEVNKNQLSSHQQLNLRYCGSSNKAKIKRVAATKRRSLQSLYWRLYYFAVARKAHARLVCNIHDSQTRCSQIF